MHLLLQFFSDSFELYRCFGHGLEMCILFGHNPQNIYCYFFYKKNFHFCGQSESILGTLRMHLLLQFYFETLQVFMSWSEDVHIVWV